MKKSSIFFTSIVIILLIAAFEIWWIRSTDQPLLSKSEREQKVLEKLQFELEDPELSPPLLRESVLRGYQIMNNTPKFAKEYAGDSLSCSNCHFAGGNTTGGKNNGLSLVGAAAQYPRYKESFGKVITLEERIQSCFEKSMNGKKIPYDSQIMTDLVAYLMWISKDIPIYKKLPWLSIPPLKTKAEADSDAGSKLYTTYCADCHGTKGEGKVEDTIYYPPLWGKSSFNRRAGLADSGNLASFIYFNMPYQLAELSEEQAIDIAAFILLQARPGDP